MGTSFGHILWWWYYPAEIIDLWKQLEAEHLRDYSSEFLELLIVFLGGVALQEIYFQHPGALCEVVGKGHYMQLECGCVVVCSKWWLQKCFTWEAWITAALAIEAPLKDFIFTRRLSQVPVVSVARRKMLLHQSWYMLMEHSGCLSLTGGYHQKWRRWCFEDIAHLILQSFWALQQLHFSAEGDWAIVPHSTSR